MGGGLVVGMCFCAFAFVLFPCVLFFGGVDYVYFFLLASGVLQLSNEFL